MEVHPNAEGIGQTIRELRKQAHFSQKKLAEVSGLSQAQISQMERGKTNPTLEVLNAVAQALNVPTWVLIAGLAVLAIGLTAAVANEAGKSSKK
ncbi:MAG: helix-turn-helix transcriptional regulator [Thermaceae bacterium]|nr:helix-turn-helix transcriptional regulator [Thermaceae bacterium]